MICTTVVTEILRQATSITPKQTIKNKIKYMADILIHSTVPSLFTQTESASNLMINPQTTTTTNESPSVNKYNGHVNRLRNVFTEQSVTSNDRTIKHDNIAYQNSTRKYSNSEQYYDFPSDTITQLRKQQNNENEPITTQFTPAFLPSNVVKRMNHVNTFFVKPTKIERFVLNTQEQPKPVESPIHSGK